MSLKSVDLPAGKTVNGRWKIIEKLGEGGFGAVYKVSNIATREECAMKVEPNNDDECMMKMEVAVLKIFRNTKSHQPHVCKYYDSGETRSFRYVVMKLVGKNLADLRKACPEQRFSGSTTARLGIQMLEAIEALHRIGFLHRDIKPANCAMGRELKDCRQVYILDFGLARQFITRDGQVRPPRKTAGFRGTVRYASINAHLKKDLGRHDDLWCWLYVMVEFRRGFLPWRRTNEKAEVGQMKMSIVSDQLLGGMEMEFFKMMNELQGLQYPDTPNYAWFYQMLTAIMNRKRYRNTDPFDWEAGEGGYEAALSIMPQPYQKQKMTQDKVVMEREEGEERSHMTNPI